MKPSQLITVGDKKIGGDSVFVIAEIGSNHNQSLQLAYETIDAAVDCGADAVKFQSINIDELYHQPSQQTIDLHKKIDLQEDWHQLLKDYCNKKGVLFFSSPTYLKSIDILEEIDVPLYKLASAQIGTFPQLVRKVAATGKPIILSTGIVNHNELDTIIEIFSEVKNPNYIILHCNSIYPTPFEKVHLPLIDVYKEKYGCIVGFSDHTPGIVGSIAAVARGAKVIEKHFTLSKDLPVPDAGISIDYAELKEMVAGIRAVEKTLVPADRLDIMEEEQAFKTAICTRLVLAVDKKEQEIINEQDITYLRSPQGIDCKLVSTVIGKKLNKNLPAGTLINYTDLA